MRSALHKDLVHTGQWSETLGKDYDFLMDLRETGDSGGVIRVSAEDARSAVECSSRILEAVRTMCPDLNRAG